MRKTSSTLIVIVLLLLSLGIVMLASTSSVRAAARHGNPSYFIKRQLLWLAVAVAAGIAVLRLDYRWWQKATPFLGVAGVVLLAMVYVPVVGGDAIGGSRRWLHLGPFSAQPSEFAKLSMVASLAAWMAGIGRGAVTFKEGLLCPVIILGAHLGFLICEPDFGTTLLAGMVGMLIMFAGGTRIAYLLISSALGGAGFLLAIMRDPLRMGRILAFVMPDKYPKTAYHLIQSKVAFINGGWFGVGLGNSIQKHRYLPEAHTDFIFAIVGEELGFLATALVVVLFLGILICGLIISLKAPDSFTRLLCFGITMLVTLQAAINMGVVTGCLPTKGLPLPFISYGGSSLVASVVSMCILLNISRHCDSGHRNSHTRSIRDRSRRPLS